MEAMFGVLSIEDCSTVPSHEELVSFEHLLRDLSDALELAGDKAQRRRSRG